MNISRLKQIKVRDNPSSEWLTNGILTSSKHNNILYKHFKKNPTVDNEITYKTYKNKLTHIIRLSKNNLDKNKFDLKKGNARKSWQLIKEVLKCKPKVTNPSTKSFTLLDGSETSNPKDIANEFNDYFIHAASNLVKDIPTTGDDPTEFVQTNTNSFFCRSTTPEEIVSLLRNIKSNMSSGFDNVEPHIMREISPQIAPLLSHIFNNSFSTGVVPRQLKIAKVIPIHKNNDPNNICNYRPISILPCFSNIMERLMYNRLERFPNQSHIISEVQYGFRKKYSTYIALINIIDKISSGTDSNSFNIGIFIDLSKAFDTIYHNILFQKLNCYGIRGHILTWFRSYLEHRTQYVTYNNVN